MGEFFRGRKRKIGCVTLVLALVGMGGWMRSRVYADFVTPYRSDGCCQFVVSAQDSIKWIKAFEPKVPTVVSPRFGFSIPVNAYPDTELEPIFGGNLITWQWHWHALGFRFGKCHVNVCGGYDVTTWQFPYWSIVIPLAALAAFLLLISRPKTTHKKLIESAVVEGT